MHEIMHIKTLDNQEIGIVVLQPRNYYKQVLLSFMVEKSKGGYDEWGC